MKILCLNPPFKAEYGRFSRTSRSPAITKSGTIYYPIWLCYAAGVLEDAGHEVKVIDSCAYGYDLEATLRIVAEFKPEMVVIDTSTPSIYSDVKTGAEIKKILPDCFVVLMGTHPSALPEDTLVILFPDHGMHAVLDEGDSSLGNHGNLIMDDMAIYIILYQK